MPDEIIHIKEWPEKQSLKVDHNFSSEAGIHVSDWPKIPLGVNMFHNVGEPVPICIKLCEPICAESNYNIGINLMGQPFAEIVIKGVTRLFNCDSHKIEKVE